MNSAIKFLHINEYLPGVDCEVKLETNLSKNFMSKSFNSHSHSMHRNSQAALDLWFGTIFIKIKFLHSMNNNDCMILAAGKHETINLEKL